jgi:hypothetical protein
MGEIGWMGMFNQQNEGANSAGEITDEPQTTSGKIENAREKKRKQADRGARLLRKVPLPDRG